MLKNYSSLLLLSVCHFLMDFMIGIWPIFKTLAGLDLALAGIIYAVSATIGEGMQVVFGHLSDRGWRKTLILGGLSLSLVGALFSFTGEPVTLFLLFLTLCIGSGAFHPAAAGLTSRLTTTRKSLYITHFAAFGLLGLGVSQIIYASVYKALDGNTLVIALPLLVLILLCLKKSVLQEAPRPAKESGHPPLLKVFSQFFKNRDMRNLYFGQISNQTIAWGFIFLLPDILKSRAFSDTLVYGGGHLAYVLGGVCLLIPSGLIADKLSSRTVIIGATGIGAAAFYTFLFFPELSDGAALTLLFTTGAAISVINPVSVAFGHKLMPHHPGMVSAFLMGCVWCVSECIGPGAGGLLTKLFSDDAPARAMMLIGVFFALGIWAALRLPQDVSAEVAEESAA